MQTPSPRRAATAAVIAATLTVLTAAHHALAISDCCTLGGLKGPGCDTLECEQLICAADPFCCAVQWDANCAFQASENCDVCNPGPCGADLNGDTKVDSFDLNTLLFYFGKGDGGDINRDTVTNSADLNLLLFAFGTTNCPGDGSCCTPNETVGCDQIQCQEEVCAIDAFCCTFPWDQGCADIAQQVCNFCADCCSPNGTPGCADPDCQTLICSADPFCCETLWDQLCADDAFLKCGVCEGCCQGNGTPDCNDTECSTIVCRLDPFCCLLDWDNICGESAVQFCSLCGADPVGACCFLDGTCSNLTFDQCISQSGIFQDEKSICSTTQCNIPASNCCYPAGVQGCEDADCQTAVCALDPACCDQEWDIICANLANDACELCQ